MRVTQVARSLPINRIAYPLCNNGLRINPTTEIIAGWITQSPNNVITKNIINWVLSWLVLSLNVNFLLAKKLKTKAIEVDIKLLGMSGKPRNLSPNKIPKSMPVLAPPTIAKRTLSACFFSRFFTVVFLNKIKWSAFSFIKYSADIFANNS